LGRALAARVLLDLVEAVDGQVELVAPGVLDGEQVDRVRADLLVDEAEVTADPVLDVDDEVARGEAPEGLDEPAALVGRAVGARGRAPGDPKISSSSPAATPPAAAPPPRESAPPPPSAARPADDGSSSSAAGSTRPSRAFTARSRCRSSVVSRSTCVSARAAT